MYMSIVQRSTAPSRRQAASGADPGGPKDAGALDRAGVAVAVRALRRRGHLERRRGGRQVQGAPARWGVALGWEET